MIKFEHKPPNKADINILPFWAYPSVLKIKEIIKIKAIKEGPYKIKFNSKYSVYMSYTQIKYKDIIDIKLYFITSII